MWKAELDDVDRGKVDERSYRDREGRKTTDSPKRDRQIQLAAVLGL